MYDLAESIIMSRFRTIVENAIAKVNKKLLKERCESLFIAPMSLHNDEREVVEVLYNPSKAEFNRAFREWGTIRGLADNEDVIIWDGYKAVHDSVKEQLEKQYGATFPTNYGTLCRFETTREYPLMLEDDTKQYSHGKELDPIKQTLFKNPNFTRLFSEEEILNADSHNFANGEFGEFQNDPEILKKFGYD